MSARGAIGGYVVSSGTFSQEAHNFAAGRNIDLWDGSKLKTVIRQDRIRPRSELSPTSPGVYTTTSFGQQATGPQAPSCPQCGAHMVLRSAKRGTNAGQQFWGCSTFPKCRGTKSYSANNQEG